MKTQDITNELEAIESARITLLGYTMTYQYDAKLIVAKYYCVPFESVNLPFREWMGLREQYEKDSGKKL